jgi:hypothetical protein
MFIEDRVQCVVAGDSIEMKRARERARAIKPHFHECFEFSWRFERPMLAINVEEEARPQRWSGESEDPPHAANPQKNQGGFGWMRCHWPIGREGMHEDFRRDIGREGQDGVGVEIQFRLNDGSASFEFL